MTNDNDAQAQTGPQPDMDAGTLREQRIPVDLSQPIMLEVHHPHGDVTVRAADRSDVLVSHDTPGLSGDDDDEAALLIDARQNRIVVRANPRAGAGWAGLGAEVDLDAVVGQITRAFRRGGPWSAVKAGTMHVAGGYASCDITIDVPRAFTGRVEIHTASGDARIEGISGEIALTTTSGDMRLAGVGGNLVLQTASGDLGIEGATGRLSARTASGDVRVISARIEQLELQSASGDIQFDAMLTGDGPYRAQTASGDVRLTLRQPTAGQEPAATLAFQTVSGDAHVTAPFRKAGRRLWQAGPGERGPRIEVTTVSGDLAAGISAVSGTFGPAASATPPADDVPPAPPASSDSDQEIARTRPATATEPAPPRVESGWRRGEAGPATAATGPDAAQPAASGEAARLAVLEAVERGELDIEEALRRLDGADVITSP